MERKNLLFDKTDRIAKLIYKLSLSFPQNYQFSLGEQIRRSSLSIILNIVEGGARISNKEKKQFLSISFSSLKETKYLIYFCFDLDLLSKETFEDLIIRINELAKILYGLMYKKKNNQYVSCYIFHVICYIVIMVKLNSFQLRQLEEQRARGVLKKIKRQPIYFILEDIYDTYNTGGIFRLADALAAEKIYLCGQTETPPNARIKKASIGTYKVVPWEYKKTADEAIKELKEKYSPELSIRNQKKALNQNKIGDKIKIIAVEQAENSIPFTQYQYQLPLALIVGNESYGIKKETLKLSDAIVEIPMYGINRSLNVIVALSIVGYWVVSMKNSKIKFE